MGIQKMENITYASGKPLMNSSLQYSRFSRQWMTLYLIISDLLSLCLASGLALSVRLLWGGQPLALDRYIKLLPLLFVFIVIYAIAGLYPTVGLNPIEEMRRLTLITTSTFFMLIVVTFLWGVAGNFSRLTLTLFWIFGLLTVPLMRWLTRRVALGAKVWGEPIAVIGSGPQTHKTVDFLNANRTLGLIPRVVVNGFSQMDENYSGILVLESKHLQETPDLLSKLHIHTAVIVPAETPLDFQSLIVDERHFGFQRLILISSLGWVGGSAIVPYDLQGVLGLEVQRKLLNASEQLMKRFMDLILVLMGSIFVLPLIGLIALLIRLESPGSSFYCQKRVGRDSKEIRVWKFRTMVVNAEQRLERCLRESPELREEWDACHKLKNDMRVTRVGAILRKTSFDEIPQLWNVLKGEMSLVGPRPIVSDEIKHYREAFRLYTQVLPGMTGLWQVSGRSDTTYESRVRLDEYYIRRWSIWMDIYILIRTFWVVVKHSGAY
jgi:Undecaprenyl-phosphate galactose phosphotransferase WbaP